MLKKVNSETKDQLDYLKTTRETDISDLKHDNLSKIEELKSNIKDQSDAFKQLNEQTTEIQRNIESENKSLDLQVAKQQISLDLMCKRLDEEKKSRSVDEKENKMLREKSSLLEGELNAWKQMKSEENKTDK